MIRFWVAGHYICSDYETEGEAVKLAAAPEASYFPGYGYAFPASERMAAHLYFRFEDKAVYDAQFWALYGAWERRIRSVGTIPHREWPRGVAAPWNHQQLAFDYLGDRLDKGNAAALFSGMGTGKSRVAIALIADRNVPVTVIVGPKAMLLEWPDMFTRDAPFLAHVISLGGTPAQKDKLIYEGHREQALDGGRLVFVTTYGSVWREPIRTYLQEDPPGMVILDESQKIKAAGSKVSLFFRDWAADNPRAARVAMTGTATHDRPLDLYGQYRFLDRRIFGTNFDQFRARYAHTIDQEKYKIITGYHDLEDLTERMYSIAFRVESDVLDLPPKMPPAYRWAELNPKARKVYRELATELAVLHEDKSLTIPHGAAKILRLQQITSGFLPLKAWDDESLIETTEITELGTEKEDALTDYLEELDPSEPVIVYARFRHDLAAIKRAAEASGRGYREQSGSSNQWREWQYELTGGEVIGVQIASGGAGVNLTRSNRVVYYSPDFSKGNFEQSQFRAYRPGQERPYYETYIMVRGTVDAQIMQALRDKMSIAALVNLVVKEIQTDGK